MRIYRKNGFTLLETLMAMLILSSGILLLASSWGGSFQRLEKTKINSEISSLLQRKMVEIDLLYRGKSVESIPEELSDDFGAEYPEYSWRLKSKDMEFPDISPMLIAREGGANENLLTVMRLFTEHLNKVIKEVMVTVVFKPEGRKSIESSITTYYVDYSKELSLPEVGGTEK